MLATGPLGLHLDVRLASKSVNATKDLLPIRRKRILLLRGSTCNHCGYKFPVMEAMSIDLLYKVD